MDALAFSIMKTKDAFSALPTFNETVWIDQRTLFNEVIVPLPDDDETDGAFDEMAERWASLD